MGNKRELFWPGNTYHIYNHSIGTSKMFFENSDYEYFLDLFRKHIYPFTELYAFCLIPNHFHLLLKIASMESIEDTMKIHNYNALINSNMSPNRKISQLFGNMFNAYTKAINKRYLRMGGLFVSDVKRKLVMDENYFTQLVLYINTNPLHHELVSKIDEWQYSSYGQTIQRSSFLINYKKTISNFGSLDNFKQMHLRYIDEIKKAGEPAL